MFSFKKSEGFERKDGIFMDYQFYLIILMIKAGLLCILYIYAFNGGDKFHFTFDTIICILFYMYMHRLKTYLCTFEYIERKYNKSFVYCVKTAVLWPYFKWHNDM